MTGLELHVAPSGQDSHSGQEQQPFKTIGQAAGAVRSARQRGREPITVWIHKGTYRLAEPLRFGPEDSGTPEAPVTWAAVPGAAVTLTGARQITARWEPYRDGIFRCAVPEARTGELSFGLLYADGRRQVRARFPNFDPAGSRVRGYEGSAYRGSGYVKPGYCYPTAPTPWPDNAELHYDPKTFSGRTWAHPEDGVLHTFNANYWGSMQFRLRGRDVKGNRLLLGEGGDQINDICLGKSATEIDSPSPYYVENIFEELDSPGEWYLDKREGFLYFMPPEGLDPNAALIEVSGPDRLVELTGTRSKPVRGLRFEGLRFTGAEPTFLKKYDYPSQGDWGIHRGGAILMGGVEDCAVKDCTFEGLGGNAVFLNNYAARVVISGNVFSDLGESAVCMVGESHLQVGVPSRCAFCGHEHRWSWGQPSENIPTDCVVEDNVIHDIGFYGKQTAGVFLALSRRIAIRHNHIYNTPRAGICFNDGLHGGHDVAFNDIHDTVLETGDHGPFNSWGREPLWCYNQSHRSASHGAGDVLKWARETTVIRNNRFRDNAGWGIDLDDGSSNYRVYGNLCIGVSVKLREGDHRVVENNIFINGANPPGSHCGYEGNRDVFRRNIVVMSKSAERVESDHDYQDQSRGAMVKLITPPGKGDWFKEWDHNLYFGDAGAFRAIVATKGGAKTYDLDAWRAMGWDRHSLYADPLFVDAPNGDYRLKEGSPALEIGFERIPTEGFGPRTPPSLGQSRSPARPTDQPHPAGQG